MPTALITGASSGIGAAFARRLAIDGYRLVLVARDRDRLRESARILEAAGSPATEILAADLTDPAGREQVVQRLRADVYPVDLLINNAGASIGKSFLDATEADLTGQLELNVTSVMLLTHAALLGMIARRHGAIINLSSIAGLLPGRGSTYSASKAWVTSFTEGLATSLRGTGVRMVAVAPGFVRTEFHERARLNMSGTPEWMYVPMSTVVDESLAGLRRGRTLVIPGPLYKAVATVATLAPRPWVRAIASRIDRDKRD